MVNLILSRIPAFGFESEHVGAASIYDKLADDGFKKLKNATNSISKLAYNTLVTKYKTEEKIKEALTKQHPFMNNRAKVMGYIPGIGTLLGLGKLIGTSMDAAQGAKLYSRWFFVRAIIETLSLGIFLLPVDIAVTIYRNRKWEKMNSNVVEVQ